MAILAGLLIGSHSAMAATSIAVDFQGRNGDGTPVAGPTPSEIAGVVPQANWNAVNNQAANNNGTATNLVTATGAATTVSLTYVANDSWNNDTDASANTSPNSKMMRGIMKASTGTAQTLTWNNLTESSYDVYLYMSENGDGSQVSVDGGNGTVYYLTETHQFTDSSRFVISTSEDSTVLPTANYVKFKGLVPTDGKITIVLQHITGTDGAGLGGMQIVSPSGDTPISIVTQPVDQLVPVGGTATLGVAAYGENQMFQWFKGATAITGATNATYTTPAAVIGDNGSKYHVVVSNGVNSQTSSEVTLTVKPATLLTGYLRHAYYKNHTRPEVESGTAGKPTFVAAIPSFSTAINAGINDYAESVSGFFTPTVTGRYVFFVAADDDSDLFLSTDSSPANKVLIAQELGWSNTREWTVSSGGSNLAQKRSDQFSPDGGATTPFAEGIQLTAGTPYYIEGVHHQGGGGDNFSATYKLIEGADPVSADPANSIAGDATLLTNSVISFNTTLTTSLTIAQDPASQTVTEGFTGTFSVVAQTDSELTPMYQWLRNGAPIAGATSQSYSFNATAADNNAKYSVLVSIPGFATTSTSAEATLTVRSPVFTSGFLKYELWNGKLRADVLNNMAGAPSVLNAISSMQTTNNAGDPPANYADRVSGFFVPAVSGNYVFFLGSDDDSDLYLSTDDTAANKKLIAQEAGYSGFLNWNTIGGGASVVGDKRSDQFAASAWPTPNVITLVAGQRYYIEAAHHEGGGGDWLGAYVKLESENDPANGTPSNLTGSRIGFFVAPATVTITTAPANATATEGSTATFTAAATTDSQVKILSYQWRRNGVDIAGANGASFTTSPLILANNNDKYSVVINAPGATAQTSAEATLTVNAGVLSVGFLKYENWPGKIRLDILNGSSGPAVTTTALTRHTTADSAGDPPSNYADRVSGFFTPETSGNYVFFVGGDDDTELFLSTDANPANRKLIARENEWSGFGNWITIGGATSSSADKRSDQYANSQWPTPNIITLVGGTRYYIEAVHREGTGGDWQGVTYKLESEEDPLDDAPTRLTGDRIAFYAPAATLTISQQPTAASAAVGFSASFSVAATTTSEYQVFRYQWQSNGVDIAGANSATYTTAPLTAANASDKYRVVVSAPGSAAQTSSEAGITLGTPEFTTGAVKREIWPGVTDRTLVETDAAGAPSIIETLPSFETPFNAGDPPSVYVDRLSGFFIPAVGGDYVFFIGSDDDSDLFLSTDDTVANKKLIAQEAGASGARIWANGADKRSDQFGATEWPTGNTITLVAGQRYYIEAVHREITGGDWVGVYAKLASAADPADGTASNLTGSNVGAVVPPQTGGGDEPELTITRGSGTVTIAWTGGGTLQQATALTGNASDWTNVTPAPTGFSYTTPATTGNQFFRVVR
jgi:hypothetical protein